MRIPIPLTGGINKDAHPMYIDAAKGEVISRKNCRVTSTDGSREGINTSIKGMTQLSFPIVPVDGTNKTIGFVEDKERDFGVFFMYNSAGNHGIYVVNGTNISSLAISSSVLDFDPAEIIDADILGDYLVFTSDYNPPRKIRIVNDAGTLLTHATADAYDIQLAVRPPSSKPTVALGSDATKKVNKLVGKTFQFAYMYVYDDYTYSVLSPYSDIVVSGTIFASEDNTYYDTNYIGNFVSVYYDLGTDNVASVKLLAREGNTGSWFVVTEYTKNGEAEYTNVNYAFYNDVARQALVETQALALYSDVPLLARTVKTVQNRIGLGNVLKGYNKTVPQVSYGISYENVSVAEESASMDNGDGIVDDSGAGIGGHSQYYVEFGLYESAVPIVIAEGNNISINVRGSYYQEQSDGSLFDFDYEYAFSYVITADDMLEADPILHISTVIEYDIDTKGVSIITADRGHTSAGWGYPTVPGSDYTVMGNIGSGTAGLVAILFADVWDGLGSTSGGPTNGGYDSAYTGSFSVDTFPSGVSTFKSGSYYNVGVLFYDEWSRTSGVLSPESVYIPHNGERLYANAYDRARIAFTLLSTTTGVPSWAKYYRFAVTESVNFAGVYPFVIGGTDNIKELKLDGKNVIALNLPTNFQYEFDKGDYLQLEVDSGAAITNTIVKPIIGTRTVLEISGTDYAGFWLIIPAGSEDNSTYDGKTAYIYRTKNEVSDLVYFEDSNTYSITNGVMQTASGYVGGEDAWFTRRKFEWDATSASPIVEDFYLNVDYAIRAYSKGRVVVEFDTLGQIRLQDIVWSFNYLDNTKINGISTFNSLNRVQLDEKDGALQRLELSGFVLRAIQDNKETSLYIGKAEVSNSDGTLQVVKSNDFIGTVRPLDGDYGSRYPLSIVQNDRDIYYFDSDKGAVVRSSPNGQFAVSDYGMKSKFLTIAKSLTSTSRVFAEFDRKNNEYFITFVIGGVAQTWSFKEAANLWNMELEYTNSSGTAADIYGKVGLQMYSFLASKVYSHETNTVHNTFYGSYKPLLVRGVVNMSPTEEKCLRSIVLDSNRGIKTTFLTPVTNTNTLGQKSVLYTGTYVLRDGCYVSPVFKNILTTAGDNLSLIHTGNDIVGKYCEIELEDNASTECQLRLMSVNLTVNK